MGNYGNIRTYLQDRVFLVLRVSYPVLAETSHFITEKAKPAKHRQMFSWHWELQCSYNKNILGTDYLSNSSFWTTIPFNKSSESNISKPATMAKKNTDFICKFEGWETHRRKNFRDRRCGPSLLVNTIINKW
jgi:hypothetical protein